jgi:hypothetical protein
MNIIDVIKGQLTPDVIGPLAGLLGESEDKTRSAAQAAVPALLQGLAGVASKQGGGDKLANALGGLDLGMLGNLAGMLGGNKAPSMLDTGLGLLNGMFGSSVLGSLISTLASFLGLGSGSTKSLLGYLAPIVMGTVAKQALGSGGGKVSASALTNLFTQQRDNIQGALPRGLSLNDIPGYLAAATGGGGPSHSSSHSSGRATAPVAEGPSLGKLLPWLLLPLAALALWWWWSSRPADTVAKVTEEGRTMVDQAREKGAMIADATNALPKLNGDLTGWFKDLETTLGGVTDEASATAALAKLKDMNTTLETVKGQVTSLNAKGRTTINSTIKSLLAGLQSTIDKLMGNAAIKAILEPVVGPMLKTLETLAA